MYSHATLEYIRNFDPWFAEGAKTVWDLIRFMWEGDYGFTEEGDYFSVDIGTSPKNALIIEALKDNDVLWKGHYFAGPYDGKYLFRKPQEVMH